MKTIFSSNTGIQKFIVVIALGLLSLSAKSQTAASNEPIAFSAMLNNNKADLKWTATGAKVNHFVIERSNDGVNFRNAALVFAFEDGAENMGYRFSDKINNDQTVIYYRLSVVNENGQVQYSATQVIRTDRQADEVASAKK